MLGQKPFPTRSGSVIFVCLENALLQVIFGDFWLLKCPWRQFLNRIWASNHSIVRRIWKQNRCSKVAVLILYSKKKRKLGSNGKISSLSRNSFYIWFFHGFVFLGCISGLFAGAKRHLEYSWKSGHYLGWHILATEISAEIPVIFCQDWRTSENNGVLLSGSNSRRFPETLPMDTKRNDAY